MKYFTKFMIVLLIFSMGACMPAGETAGKKARMELVWETAIGMDVPESVIYDPKNQVLYVSNISGKPTLKNGRGYIARLNLDGTLETRVWVGGLNAPKGMGIFGDTLYVTDIDRIHAIDIPTAAIHKTWDVAGAKFLNDIAIDGTGAVYITDMATKTIHVIKEGQVDSFLVLGYNKPNGLLMRGSILLVGTADGLLKIDIPSKTVVLEIAHPGGIDGLKPLGRGQFIVSDWKGKIEIIEKGQQQVLLMDTSAQKINAADFEYIPDKKWVMVPTFFDNRILAYHLQ